MVTKPVFDWTINLGHVLTFVGFITTGLVVYQSLEKRVVILEQSAIYQSSRDAAQDMASRELRQEIRDALKDVRVSLERVNDKLDARPQSK